MDRFSNKLLRRVFQGCGIAMLLATSLHATPVTSQYLQLSWYAPGQDNGVAGSESVLNTGEFALNGWVGSASLITNTSVGSDFSLPFTFNLTNVSLTCLNEGGCGYLEFDFSINVTFDEVPVLPSGPIPFTVSLDGSGPSAGFGLNFASSFLSSFWPIGELPEGEYNFLNSGFVSANSSDSGNKTIKGNPSLFIGGYFAVGGGEFLQTISLPHSFDAQVGDSAETPEPATLFLSGALLTALAVGVRRRKA